MKLAHLIEFRQQQTQRIDPRQILASEILAWTTAELECAIEREMAENPALEARDSEAAAQLSSLSPFSAPSPADETSFAPARSTAADHIATPERAVDLRTSGTGDDTNPWSCPALPRSSEGETEDPLDRVASHLTLRDHLRQQVGQVAADLGQAELVRYLIECVDDRGYLVADMEEVAEDFRVSGSEAERAVLALQAMDPPGVGARDLRECLLLQAEYLQQTGEGHPLVLPLLKRCWDDLVARREDRMASRLRTTRETVQTALASLQRSTTPYPGSTFRPSSGPGRGGSPSSPAVRPDIVFHRLEGGFQVELTRDFEALITVAPHWKKLAEQQPGSRYGEHRASATGRSEESMRRYLREHVDRAQGFLSGVARRGQTLRKIANALAELQQGYLETGNRAFLRPLTRQTLAELLELDESVVSRAVADKWAQLPGGEVVALDAFFGNAHAVREALASLVMSEDPSHPYSDDELADLLTAQGFLLARRTVAKYRGLEKILPARLRRRLPENGNYELPRAA